jgi:hypothetical protein
VAPTLLLLLTLVAVAGGQTLGPLACEDAREILCLPDERSADRAWCTGAFVEAVPLGRPVDPRQRPVFFIQYADGRETTGAVRVDLSGLEDSERNYVVWEHAREKMGTRHLRPAKQVYDPEGVRRVRRVALHQVGARELAAWVGGGCVPAGRFLGLAVPETAEVPRGRKLPMRAKDRDFADRLFRRGRYSKEAREPPVYRLRSGRETRGR